MMVAIRIERSKKKRLHDSTRIGIGPLHPANMVGLAV